MAAALLNVADIRLRSRVNGPGVRSVVWVQGCDLGCPGCFNPHMHPHAPVRLLDPKRLGHELADIRGTDGITISGGEPFQQAQACADLAATVRGYGRSVMVFSGYEFECLRRSPVQSVQRLLACIDLLVAGPYLQDLKGDGSSWRGSTNQKVHLLTDRLAEALRAITSNTPVVEIMTDGATLSSTGFPDEEDREWLEQQV